MCSRGVISEVAVFFRTPGPKVVVLPGGSRFSESTFWTPLEMEWQILTNRRVNLAPSIVVIPTELQSRSGTVQLISSEREHKHHKYTHKFRLSMSLHVYSLPQELLQSLAPRNSLGNRQEPPKPPSPEPVPSSSTSATRACNICLGITFLDVDQQRAHFRSDWHRYNVKNRLKGGQPVAESDFNQLIMVWLSKIMKELD